MTSDLRQALQELDFRGLDENLDDFLSHATAKRLSAVQIVEQIVDIERKNRSQRSLERRQSRAKIGHFKPICDFDWNWPTEVDRQAVERALRGTFIDEGANVVLAGPHGLGKTMILKNIAHEAVLHGHAVLFISAQKMLGELSAIDSPTKLERKLKHYSRIRLLCVDEVGYLSYDSRAADLFFEIVNRRYQAKKSIVMTTNLAFKDWNTVFPNATCTVALVDRLCHRADIIKIAGKSWRRKEAVERQERLNEEDNQ